MFWKKLSFKQIDQLDRDILILIPIGTMEAHGGHLPVLTDILIPISLCQQISKKIKSVIAPEISFGICDSMLKFPGTINVRSETMSMLLSDYLDSIIGYGFKNIYLLNGHGGNEEILKNIIHKYSPKVNIKTKDWYDLEYVKKLKLSDTTYLGDHADRLETEMLLYSHPKLVDLKQATDDYFEWPNPDPDEYSKIMPNAVYGYPSKSNPSSATDNFTNITNLIIEDINIFLNKK